MKNHVLFYSLIIMCLFTVACTSRQDATEQAEEANEQQFEGNDQMEDVSEFMVEAYNQNALINEASQMAAQKARSEQVKQFAQQSVDKHNKVKQQIETFASQINVALPDSLSNEYRRKVDDLASANETEFDQKYVDLIDDASEEMVKKFEDVPDGAENTELNNFVQQTLPDLRQHKEETDQLEESI